MKFFAIFAILLIAAAASATFLETSLPTAGTATSFSTLSTITQNGTNGSISVVSTNTTDTQNATVSYLTSDGNARSVQLTLSGTTAVSSVSSPTYLVTNSTYAVETGANYTAFAINNSVGSLFVYLGNRTEPGGVVNASFNVSGIVNGTTVVSVYFDGAFVMNVTAANGSSTKTFTVNSTNLMGVNNFTFVGSNTTEPANITEAKLAQEAIISSNVTFILTDINGSWSLTSNGNGSLTCQNYSNVTMLVGDFVAMTNNFTSSNSSLNSNTSVTGTPFATIYSLGRHPNITLLKNTYWSQVWIRDANNMSTLVDARNSSLCLNSSVISSDAANQTIQTNMFSVNGTKMNVTDVSFITGVQLSSAAAGTVAVKNSAGAVVYNVSIGNYTPTDNGGSPFCQSVTGCTITTLLYGGDGNIRLRANATSTAGTSRIVYTAYDLAYTMVQYGVGLIRWNYGERLTFYGTPSSNGTNVSIYYLVG